jgi:hypothetical protein
MSALLALAMQVAAQPSSPPPKLSRARLDTMADACRAPRKWLALRGNEILFRGRPDANQHKIECVLKKISAVVAASNLGFAGNEEITEEN